jgi:hypothetical protein
MVIFLQEFGNRHGIPIRGIFGRLRSEPVKKRLLTDALREIPGNVRKKIEADQNKLYARVREEAAAAKERKKTAVQK